MRKLLLASACAALLSPTTALAELSENWNGDVGLNYSMKRGNSYSDSLSGKVDAEREMTKWRHLVKLEADNEQKKSSGVKSRVDERYFGSYKLDHKIDEANYIFNLLTAEKDRFSGYTYETTYALGYGRRFFDNDRHRLDIEAGPGFRLREIEERPADYSSNKSRTEKDPIGIVGARYKLNITENAYFKEDISSEFEDGSTVTKAETSLTSNINSWLAMRLSHVLRHNSKRPTDENRKTDQEILVGLVVKL